MKTVKNVKASIYVDPLKNIIVIWKPMVFLEKDWSEDQELFGTIPTKEVTIFLKI